MTLHPTRSQKPTRTRGASRRSSRRYGSRKRSRLGWQGRAILACAVLAAGLLAWAAVERALAPASNTAQDSFDALIVLGNPADADGNPSPTQLARVTEGVREYERGVASRIIFTGGAAKNRFVEAQVMARTAEAQGIPASAVYLDSEAKSTIENTCNAFAILRSHNWHSAEVISSPYHLPRAAVMLRRLPMKWRVHAAPALGPAGAAGEAFESSLEVLKTLYYLVWTRQTEPCAAASEPFSGQ